MVIDILSNLFDRLIQLAKYHEEIRHDLYNNYVIPAYSQFEIVHNNYLESFKKYREIIKSSDESTDIKHSILDKIQEDSLFTANQRVNLLELSKLSDKPVVGRFIDTIFKYSLDATGEIDPKEWSLNIIRHNFIYELGLIFGSPPKIDENKKDCALNVLDKHVEVLQHQYSLVTKEFMLLKKNLLMK